MLQTRKESTMTGAVLLMRKPDIERSNILVMLQMLQLATESFVERGPQDYSDEELGVILGVVDTLSSHFILRNREQLTVRQTSVFFERTKDEVNKAEPGLLVDSTFMPHASKLTVSLAMDWGLVTGMIVAPDTATIH